MLNLSPLFLALADLLDQGDEEIAKIGAAALRRHAPSTCKPHSNNLTTHGEITALLHTPNALSCATAIIPVMNQLSWHYSGLDDGRISENVARRMQTVELIGADGMIFDETCRVGLFSQTANTDYAIRTHAASELFVMIAGQAEWMKGEEPYVLRHPAARVDHSSHQPHASRTTNSAMIAVWVWAGDLGYDKYQYTDKANPMQGNKK